MLSSLVVKGVRRSDISKDTRHIDNDEDYWKAEETADSSTEAHLFFFCQRGLIASKRVPTVGTLVFELLPTILTASDESTNPKEQDQQPTSELNGTLNSSQALLMTDRTFTFNRQL